MRKKGVIGIFDSGVGGLTIWRDIVELLPFQSTIYVADSINAPYGNKSPHMILNLSRWHTQRLVEMGANVVVVACNTATTQAIEILRKEFDVPIVGIEPAIKPAAQASSTGSIAVLATQGTLDSGHFLQTKNRFSRHIEVSTQVGHGLVEAIEQGCLNTKKIRQLLQKHLSKIINQRTDHLVLGCTHYPLLKPLIKDLVDSNVTILDSGLPVAQQTKRVLKTSGLLQTEDENTLHRLITTGSLKVLKMIVKEIGKGNMTNVSYSTLYQSE